jgi:hypothetical protein
MYDLFIVGNVSRDIVEYNNKIYQVNGGGCYYNLLSFCQFNKMRYSVGCYSNVAVNYDSDEIQNLNVNEKDFEKPTVFDYVNGNHFINEIKMDKHVSTNHLHLSLRKGIDFETVLSNVEFSSISVDVDINSLTEIVENLLLFDFEIDVLFCNFAEYSKIKDYNLKVKKTIITNEDKPILVIDNNGICNAFILPKVETKGFYLGAGDSFVGGYLFGYLSGKDETEMIQHGFISSIWCLNKVELTSDSGGVNTTSWVKNYKIKKIPDIIVVIGPSCAGKSTFISKLNSMILYDVSDDYSALKEKFLIDNHEHDVQKLQYFNNDYNNYGICSKQDINGGYVIINPDLWDIIIDKMLNIEAFSSLIFECSRGKDKAYIESRNISLDHVYDYLFRTINIKKEFDSEVLVINIVASHTNRIARNEKRRKNGGHFVSKRTMDEIYKYYPLFNEGIVKEIKNSLKLNKFHFMTISNDNSQNLEYTDVLESLYNNIK